VKFSFIQRHLQAFPVELTCEVLEVSRSGYYAWQKRPPSARQSRREELLVKIQTAHEENHGVYGSPRICRLLQAQGQSVCQNTVAKVMAEEEIRAKTKKKFIPRTTDTHPDKKHHHRMNLLLSRMDEQQRR
jgi:hypothetical protein